MSLKYQDDDSKAVLPKDQQPKSDIPINTSTIKLRACNNSNAGIYRATLRSQAARDNSDQCPNRIHGVSYQDLDVHGFGGTTNYQETFNNYPLACLEWLLSLFGRSSLPNVRIDILRDFEGLAKAGEMTLVLGRPGSGCSTLLKILAGHTSGLVVSTRAKVCYKGIVYMHSKGN